MSIFDQARTALSKLKNQAGSLAVNAAKSYYQTTPYAQITNPNSSLRKYVAGQIVEPIKQGVQTFNQPGIGNKAMGAAQVVGGVVNAHPVSALWNIGMAPVIGGVQSVRTGKPFSETASQALYNPTSFATQGLGIKNPILALGVDVLATHKLGRAIAPIANAGKVAKFTMHPMDTEELIKAQDLLTNPKRYEAALTAGAKNPQQYAQMMEKALQDAEELIRNLAQRHLPTKKLASIGDDPIKLATELYKLNQKNKLGLFKNPTPTNQYLVEKKSALTEKVGQTDRISPQQGDLTSVGTILKNKSPLGQSIQGGGTGTPSSPENITDPIAKITSLLKEAQPMRGQQEALYSAERARRAGAVAGIGKSMGGEAGFHAQLGALKGELPKVQFERIRNGLQQGDIDTLFNKVEGANMSPFEKVAAKGGLAKLLGAEGGQVPNKSELKLLAEVFPQDMIEAIQSKRPFMQRLWGTALNALNVPRAIMATADLSAPLRQGVFLVGRPKQWIPAFRDMFKYAGSEKAYQGLLEDIKSRPTYQAMRDNKLAITDMGPILSSREEAFMSSLPEKIPLFGKIVKGSNRAYSGFLNKLRADTFDSLYKGAQEQGVANATTTKNIAEFVNAATGRGNLGKFQKAAEILNATMFSPRLVASRVQLLNPAFYVKLDPYVRKEALKSLLGFVGTGTAVLGLAKLAGAEVGVDPRSSDFGKIKIGNTRLDIWGGFQQYVKLASQLATGQIVSSTTGKVMTLGEGYKPLTRKDIIVRFFESKTSPVASFITNLVTGQNGLGEKTNIPAEVISRFIPLLAQDMYDLYQDKGPGGLALAIPGVFGVGSQTYGKQELVTGKNQLGQPTSTIQNKADLPTVISNKIFGQQTLGPTANYSVQAYYDQLLKMPKEQAAQIYDNLARTNPDLAKKITQEATDRQKGITVKDQTLKGMGVANGDRAIKLAKEFKKLKTQQEKAALWDHYVKTGVITKEVAKQLTDLLKQ